MNTAVQQNEQTVIDTLRHKLCVMKHSLGNDNVSVLSYQNLWRVVLRNKNIKEIKRLVKNQSYEFFAAGDQQVSWKITRTDESKNEEYIIDGIENGVVIYKGFFNKNALKF